ncbi:hypothetical protein F0562_018502 [Nyssa sinensis]|uniref:Uncharacterized protein n=1 Tax=Nyssa sinensis TaxID=561372 RepID=A0A5J4ZCI7_9ASTE|nr:hypothetical protein F0562_018502 [Nyssa sinensis]
MVKSLKALRVPPAPPKAATNHADTLDSLEPEQGISHGGWGSGSGGYGCQGGGGGFACLDAEGHEGAGTFLSGHPGSGIGDGSRDGSGAGGDGSLY